MLSRARVTLGLAVSTSLIALAASCEKVPLLAPTGSTIALSAPVTVLPANGSTTIVAQVLEAAGTAPHSGTHVTFTTNLGRITPADAETDTAGRAFANFSPNGNNGTATIGAISGAATTGTDGVLKIVVGTAAVGSVSVGASPTTVAATGGASTVSAFVFDINGNALAGAPVVFTSTAGTLSLPVVATDGVGVASTILTTSQQATVTARVGAQGTTTPSTPTAPAAGTASGSITINVSAAPTILITPPTTPPSKGLPASFTFVVTAAAQNGSAVRSVVANWGDGETQPLGSFTGSQAVQHVYRNDGVFTVTGVVTDAAGSTNTASTSVFVTLPTPLGINITSSPVPAKANTLTTFTIVLTAPPGTGVTNVAINYGDGSTDTLGGGGTARTAQHTYTTPGTYTVTVTAIDTLGQASTGTTTVSVGL